MSVEAIAQEAYAGVLQTSMTDPADLADPLPRTTLAVDPRRPGRAMACVWCWCGRFYTLTPEAMVRCAMNGERPCPNHECGKGEE